jgi:ankyrin repeat protein
MKIPDNIKLALKGMNFQTHFGIVAAAGIGLSLFFTACSDPQKVARKSVEAKGYELNVKDLLVAAAAGDVAGLEHFQAAGFDMDSVDPAGNTALIKAAGAGQTGAVERLLGMGADPRKVNGVGRDALLAASAKGYEEVARLLLSRGADTTVRDAEGWGALSIAAFNGHANVVSLLAANATPAELDDALLVSSFSGDAKVIDTLLGQGANINARSPESKTPLMIASEAGKIEAVRTLLQNQANPFAVDLNNQTAANLALSAGHESVSQLITNPDQWGKSPEGEKLAGEMESARSALEGEGVEETLLDGKPLQGEPNRDLLVKKSDPGAPAAPPPAAGGTPAVQTGAGNAGEVTPKAAAATAGSPVVAATRPAAEAGTTTAAGTASRETLAAGTVAGAVVPATPVGNPAASPETKQVRIETSRKVREASKSKPIVALNGSTIHSRFPEQAPVKSMVLAAYHEESLPLVVDGVSGSTASVRRLDQTSGSIAVEKGAVIPGTPYKVKEVTPRFVSSKEGKGRMVDVSRVEVEDTLSGSTHTLVKDASGQTADTYAILTAPNSQYRYVVKAGDVFRTTQPEVGAKDYQVLDIRANAVVIKDLSTEEVTTVARDGVIQP